MPSDSLIIKHLHNKNQEAVVAIIEKYGDALYGIIYRSVESEKLAGRILEQTFVQVWQQIADYNEAEERLFNWIVKIVKQVKTKNLNIAA